MGLVDNFLFDHLLLTELKNLNPFSIKSFFVEEVQNMPFNDINSWSNSCGNTPDTILF